MEQSSRLGYGLVLVAISLVFFILYFPVLLILFVHKEFRRSTAYTIMKHIGVIDALQLIIHMYSAVLVMADLQLGYTVQKIVGALLTALWFSMLIFTMFLTFNRLSTILLVKRLPILTSTNLNYALFFVSYLSFLIPFVLKLFPDCNYVFDPNTFSWSYLPTDESISVIMSDISKYLILATVILSTVSYASIFCHIGFCSSTKLSKRELWITIQVSMVALYYLFAFIYWNYLMPLFGISTFNDFLSCVVWVVMNGIHSVIYLIFNQSTTSSMECLIDTNYSGVSLTASSRPFRRKAETNSSHWDVLCPVF